ncbi:L-seryl-tRNA(Sec) selenium transferase [Desulfobacterales bacterium HSG17]|nr:L-seryl-tRNA(Sec) selenium transferase [Desulfobacterales bacterium HSG17]
MTYFMVFNLWLTDSEQYMQLNDAQKNKLQEIPGVDRILAACQSSVAFADTPIQVLTVCVRAHLDSLRTRILQDKDLSENFAEAEVIAGIEKRVRTTLVPKLVRCINATGIVIHTNLGRSLLAKPALQNLSTIGGHYSNLEFDLAQGKRGSRYQAVVDIIIELTGAEAVMVVNNNAAAVLLCLETIARDREVIVSRGELVEIGGSFRVPDIMAKSGGILKEIGTTNRTHPKDYETAVNPNTALLLKVHTSNFSVVGFTKSVSVKELVEIGNTQGLPVMEDLGSGTLIDFSAFGFPPETTVQQSVADGADVVTFSGDKLLGGPQAGIIVGKADIIDKIRQNPLNRALRIDKLTLAALESTLRLYRNHAQALLEIPTLRLLTQPIDEIQKKADQLQTLLEQLHLPDLALTQIKADSKAGGGSLPLLKLPSICLAISSARISTARIEKYLRAASPPIIGRIEDDRFIMDLRTIFDDDLDYIGSAVSKLFTSEP